MAIEAVNLTKEYERRGQKFRAVNDVSFTIEKGKITAVMGRSGSGKSTLLNLLTGMISPDVGEVMIDGKELGIMKEQEKRRLRAVRIGIIPQSQSLIGGLTVAENIRLQTDLKDGFEKQGNTRRRELYAELIRNLGMEELLEVLPHKLSGGEMKRAAIARALAKDPDYIFADEPTGELDEENVKRVMRLFRKEAERGKAVFMITHDHAAGEKADIKYQMENGKISQLN